MTGTDARMELKSCPFCGGDAEFVRHGTNRQSSIVACQECGARVETSETWNEGQLWNTRPSPASEGVREELASTIHKARWPTDRTLAATPFAEEDRNGRDYCFRIADAVLATGMISAPSEAGGWMPIETVPRDREVEVRGVWKLRGDGVEFTHWRTLDAPIPTKPDGGDASVSPPVKEESPGRG